MASWMRRNSNAFEVDGDGPPQKLLLQPRSGENDIERKMRAAVNEWEHSRARQEIRIGKDEIEVMPPHRLDERVDDRRRDRCRDIDIRAETRASPDDCRLRAEQVPRKALFSHYGGHAAEKLSDRSAT